MSNADLSGKDWWHKNQAKYPNSQSVDDLDPGFRSSVEDFLSSLRTAGASVVISSTRRNATRAFLMHYSWQVAYGEIDPAEVPQRSGLTIEWDHGNVEKSKRGALEMVTLFNMAHIAALNSNHIAGKAIDMNISWNGTLVLTRPTPLLAKIESLPRTGRDNRELHDIGAATFGVRKLRSDPPHWSYNGK
jgi:hypothetical protein